MGIHRLSKEELIERNEKIFRMIEIGADYHDIGRRYGLSAGTIKSILGRARRDQKRKIRSWGDNPFSLERACNVDI